MNICRPSIRAEDSMTATSFRSFTMRSRTLVPSSRWESSRPRNITVTRALFDSSRNSRIFRIFVS